jgi:hypothetical protein
MRFAPVAKLRGWGCPIFKQRFHAIIVTGSSLQGSTQFREIEETPEFILHPWQTA